MKRVGRLAPGLARLRACRDGAAILEFALVLPILMALVAGCFELGRALIVYRQVGEAARAGARMLAREPEPACRPACSPGVLRILALAADQVAGNARLAGRSVTAVVVDPPQSGMVGVRVDVQLDTDLLALLGLDRLLKFSLTRHEARLAS